MNMEEKVLKELEKPKERKREIEKKYELVWVYNQKKRVGNCPKLRD